MEKGQNPLLCVFKGGAKKFDHDDDDLLLLLRLGAKECFATTTTTITFEMHKRWWWWYYNNERKIARRVSKVFSLSLSSVCLSLILWHFLVVPLDFPSALPVRILPPAPSDDAKREPDERLFRHVHVLRHAVVHRLTHSSSSSSSFGTQKCVCVSTQNFCKRENVCRRRTDDGRQKRKKKRVLNPNRPSFGDACFDLD